MRTYIFILINLISLNTFSQKITSINDVDKRVFLKYNEAEIKKMISENPKEIEKINFLFSKSFQYIPSDSINKVENFNPLSINISEYDHLRYENEPRIVFLSRDHDRIILLSKKQLDKEIQRINNKP
jgi:hypothetical protein